MNTYLYNGHVVTASSKKKALVIASSHSNKQLEDLFVEIFKGYLPEETVRKYSKELDTDVFYGFWFKDGELVYEAYKDQNDSVKWLIENRNIESFDEYYQELQEAYLDDELRVFDEVYDNLEKFLEENELELEDDFDNLKDRIRDYCWYKTPNFLDETLETFIEVKNTPEIKKRVYGSSSNINIANKCVKHKLSKEVEESLLDCAKSYSKFSSDEFDELSDKEKVTEIVRFLDMEDKRSSHDEIIYMTDVSITVRDYLSILDSSSDYKEKVNEVDVSERSETLLNYGSWSYCDSINTKIDKLKLEDIKGVSLKNAYA